MKKYEQKINKKSFQCLCRDDLGICKDENIDYIALNSYTSPTTVKRILKKFYDRALNLPIEIFDKIFNDTK